MTESVFRVTAESVHYLSQSDEWPTPQRRYDDLHREFRFTLDPAATKENAKCAKFFTREDDGLSQDWSGETVFLNPPFGRVIGQWVKKAYESSVQGSTVVCLLPARTDTRWWHDYVLRSKEIRWIRGRIRFEGGRHVAPFPSVVVVFKSNHSRTFAPKLRRGRLQSSPNQIEMKL